MNKTITHNEADYFRGEVTLGGIQYSVYARLYDDGRKIVHVNVRRA